MTPAQQTIVKSSFAKFVPIADVAATLFYEDLFARDPKLRSLFKDDMAEQRHKLMAMLATAVKHLDDWHTVKMPVRALGRRHVGYGVTPADYSTVGAALLATLEKGLGEDFTSEVREAWEACIALVATEMLDGASLI
jgi:hemoglobin-like flavoprotein